MNILVMSDIHGNIGALGSVLGAAERYGVSGCILLGDLIDYGMHSNEVIETIESLPYRIECSILGNHEAAIMDGDYSGFSSKRGADSARYTRGILNDRSWDHLKERMVRGPCEFTLGGKRCLAVHGSLDDPYWRSIHPGADLKGYERYDYVFSGHSHIPHFFETFHDADDPDTGNRRKTVFVNPGSVGQPRNLNRHAQYAVFDAETGELHFGKAEYDIGKEQRSFNGKVDAFYMRRLERGI